MVVSVALAAPAEQARRTDWETTTLAAPLAANPSRSRRVRRARSGDADRAPRNLFDTADLKSRSDRHAKPLLNALLIRIHAPGAILSAIVSNCTLELRTAP
jgi:hypothetical protein